MKSPRGRIVVIGVGSAFRRDDGAGWAVVSLLVAERARRRLPDRTELHISEGDPARLLSLWDSVGLAIVIDAARTATAQPGRVHRWEMDRARPVPEGGVASSHGLGPWDAVELAAALDRLPARMIVYAIEAADTGFGMGLSSSVAAVLGEAVEGVVREARTFAGLPTTGPARGDTDCPHSAKSRRDVQSDCG